MTISKRRAISLVALIVMLAASTPAFAQRGGRGAPSLPSQSRVPAGRFPGFPPNAGIGQPADIGQPAKLPPDRADSRAVDAVANGSRPELAGAGAVADQLDRNERLSNQLADMLGVSEPGLTTEPDGFRNLGLFVAAVQVSNRVEGTTFEGLKANMLEGDGMSLGKAIREETAMSEAEAAEAATEAAEAAAEIIEETS